ncbi:MAG: Uma2 family endonuclease [Bacillota bacterium]|nr:Uma2 family endonuclease [Bacillota bacterium]
MSVPFSKLKVPYNYGDYLSWSDDERWELIDGIPYSMSPAPLVEHQRISREILRQFSNYLVDKTCEVFGAPFDVRMPSADEKDEDIQSLVQPDIVVICDKKRLDRRGYRGCKATISDYP